MDWKQLLSLKKFGDTKVRERKDENPSRIGFEVDYDRIIFSNAFRSLQDKTQVIPLSKTDFVHTRLTHSLEVSVVGRSIGRLAGAQIIEKYTELTDLGYTINDFGSIVAAACLCHDIGNPPFGHSGEKAIGDFFKHGAGEHFRLDLEPAQWQDLIDFEEIEFAFSKQNIKLTKRDILLMLLVTSLGIIISLIFISNLYAFLIGSLIITFGNFKILLTKYKRCLSE